MGKWSAFLISLIPAALAGYLCFLLVTVGLPIVEESAIMWGPLGAGFLGCVMCLLAPFGIAIFVSSAPKAAAAGVPVTDDLDIEDDEEMLSGEEEAFESDEFASDEFSDEDDLVSDDFESDDEFDLDDSSTDFQSAELASDEFSGDLDEFDLGDEDEDDDDLFK
ncbi:MAG TPA: hypothetical protein DD473_19010 [Planctomycetaceae bacterium]|nr:hypothetical protein [Planctomycetaceae bacterium]|tara:strand:+ start:172 stop:663 length:492 start_codon:yes stop_codon:yes gene_type:complete